MHVPIQQEQVQIGSEQAQSSEVQCEAQCGASTTPSAPADVPALIVVDTAADGRPCCHLAPSKGVQIPWAQYKTQINTCCQMHGTSVDYLQKLLCDANVHTQHKALKSYLGC